MKQPYPSSTWFDFHKLSFPINRNKIFCTPQTKQFSDIRLPTNKSEFHLSKIFDLCIPLLRCLHGSFPPDALIHWKIVQYSGVNASICWKALEEMQ